MSELLHLFRLKDAFSGVLLEKNREAQQSSSREIASATNIQRLFRGNRARVRILIKNKKANEIERVFRGNMGRKKARNAARLKSERRLLSMFHFFAVQLQRVFRGFYSRLHKHSYFLRKKTIQGLFSKGEEVRAMMAQYAADQEEREQMESREKKQREFKTYAENLHHLVSTKHVPGIFRPPSQLLEEPTMNDIHVEDHVRGVVSDLLRAKGITKTGLIRDINGTKKIPLKGLKSRLSLQASVPYDLQKKETAQKLMLHKILTSDKGNFFSGGKTSVIDKNTLPLCDSDPFMDQWANPLMIRGIPEDQQQLNESAQIVRKPLFIQPIEKPFISRTGGNKSATLPNDVFDVMAEAEETGGALQRHLGLSVRFGLPESADNRRAGGNCNDPAPPPIRTTSFKPTRPRIRTITLSVKKAAMLEAENGNNYDSSDED